MKKSIDKTFMDYGIRKDDLMIIVTTCEMNGIDSEWLKECVLKPYNTEKSKSEYSLLKEKDAEKILNRAIEQI